jgi:hypothetical protein
MAKQCFLTFEGPEILARRAGAPPIAFRNDAVDGVATIANRLAAREFAIGLDVDCEPCVLGVESVQPNVHVAVGVDSTRLIELLVARLVGK